VSARGLIVSAPRSSSGKTTVTLGLLVALARRGTAVRAAKSGPDYIDPAFHAAATGAKGINLDSWAMLPSLIDALIAEAAQSAEVLVIEGAMGLFGGASRVARAPPPTSPDVWVCPCFWCSTCRASLNRPPRWPPALPPFIHPSTSRAWCSTGSAANGIAG
jgi:hypothetical protein